MPLPQIKLVTASGGELPMVDCVKAAIEVQGEKFTHNFLVVDNLITPVILEIDFLQEQRLTLNFSHTPVMMTEPAATVEALDILKPIWEAQQRVCERYCGSIGLEHSEGNIDECTVPKFDAPFQVDLPICTKPMFECVLKDYSKLFKTLPGQTTVTHHHIPTAGSPTRVPPR